MRREMLLASVCVWALAAPVAAQGAAGQAGDPQSAPVPQSPAELNSPQGGAPTTTTPDAGLADIVVTAQRVSESSQRAPIAISVIRPEDLVRQAVTRPEDLSRIVPALVATSAGGSYTTFQIRGVGNGALNAYSDPAVAFNYDGVYIGRPSSTSGTFYDLQRVEVLKGPQGTLYGRNATGGAINVIPNKPKLREFAVDGVASYGNYDAVTAQGAVNVPAGEHVAFRLAGSYARHDGYQTDGTFNQKEYGARAQAYWEASPDLNLRISGDYADQGNRSFNTYLASVAPIFGPTGITGFNVIPSGLKPGQGLLDPASRAYFASQYASAAGRAGAVIQGQPFTDNDYYGILGELNWKVGPGTLTVEPAYRDSKLNNLITPGMNGAGTDEHDRQTSVEARYAASVGSLDLLIGGFYFNEKIATNTYFSQFTLVPYQDFSTKTDSYAGFGKLTWHATSKLSLSAAGRYTKDDKDFSGLSDLYLLFCGNPALGNRCPTTPFIPLVPDAAQLRAFYAARNIPVTNVPLYVLPPFLGGSQTAPFVLNAPVAIDATLKNDKFTYRLAADYQFNGRSMVYASYETGYHSGGFAFARGLETYKPETISAWTLGTKNRFFNNRVQLNVEGFYWRYRNQQVSQFGFDLGNPPATVYLTRNIGRSSIYGIDADAQVLLTRNTLLNANVQYVHTNFDSYVYFLPNQGSPPITQCGYAPTTQTVNGSTLAVYRIDCSGQESLNTPKWSFNLNGQQTIPLGDYKLVLQAGTRYRGRAQQDPNFSRYFFAKAGTLSNASVTFGPADERWFVTGFINNLENYRRLFAVSQVSSTGNYIGSYEAPRTYGVRAGFRFR